MMQPVTKLPSWQIWRATNTHQCNIVSVWPDLAKFRHFTTTLKNCGHFERVQKLFAKAYFGQFYMLLGKLSLLKMVKY